MTSLYKKKPWLKQYSPWLPPELEIPEEDLVQILKRSIKSGAGMAIYYFHRAISYAEVDRWSDSLARALQDLGLKPGDRVIFLMQNLPQFVIGQYAVWKAGGIVVPLNPTYKEKELDYYFQDSGARALIALSSPYEMSGRNIVKERKIEIVITTSGLEFLTPDEPVPRVLQEEKDLRFPEALDFMELLKNTREKSPPRRNCPTSRRPTLPIPRGPPVLPKGL